MIKINSENILKKKIGFWNGIREKSLGRLCARRQHFVKEVFKNKNSYGYDFLNLPDDKKMLSDIKKFAAEQKKNEWENIVVLGIGGSALGLIAIQDALLGPLHNVFNKPRLFVVDNIDPDYTETLLSNIDLDKTLFIVISKSGTTTEPMLLYGVVKDRLTKNDYAKHFVFITDPKKGELLKIAKKEGIPVFPVPEKVGGRFSVLSCVGLLPAALAGVDISNIMKGALEMRGLINKTEAEKNPALLLAILQYVMDRKKCRPMTVLMPYSNYLYRFSDWYRQLLAESIGKNKKTGPTPVSALGTTDQHSQLQLYNEGPENKFIIFMRVLKHKADPMNGSKMPKDMAFLNSKKMGFVLDASYKGTAESLAHNKRPNITIEIPEINPKNLGGLFMLFEFQMALLGLLYKVDAFNQPGVEHSKILTKQILSQTK